MQQPKGAGHSVTVLYIAGPLCLAALRMARQSLLTPNAKNALRLDGLAFGVAFVEHHPKSSTTVVR